MKEKTRKRIDLVIKIVLIIIIILLLLRNCTLLCCDKGCQNSDDVDVIEIQCENNVCVKTLKSIESLSFVQDKVSVKKGETTNLIVSIKPSGLLLSKLTWGSSDTSVVTVDANGVVKGIKTGTAIITVTSANGKTATCEVTVTEDTVLVEEIKLILDNKTIEAGDMTQISAIIEPANATNRDLIWTSSDSSIAVVNNRGVVKGIKPGTVTITAKTKDGKVVATTTITVNPKSPDQIESLSFAQDKVSVKKGETTNLIVTVKPSELSSSKLTWKSSDASIATVDANGVVTGIKPGKVTITVTSSNGKTATCEVTVTEDTVLVEEIILTPEEDTISVGSTTQVNAVIKPANATNRNLVWTCSDESKAIVDANGVVTGIKSGTVTITAKTEDGKVVATTAITIQDGEFEVYDANHTAVTWNGASNLNIFTKTAHTMEGKIAPESSNTYQFIIKNGTPYNLKYQIKFVEVNNYNINMKYKLKKDGTYLMDHYVKASELNVSDLLINSGESSTFDLEWKWISSSNDTNVGENPEASYGLKIEVDAEGTND